MKLVVLITSFLLISFLRAEELVERGVREEIRRDSVKTDNSLGLNECVFHFQFKGNFNSLAPYVIDYSIDDVIYRDTLNENKTMEISLKAGSHRFQFYCHNKFMKFEEVTTGDLTSDAQRHNYFSVRLRDGNENMLVKKPVIYCYPTEKTAVSIKLKVNGNLTFTYPEYKNVWNFIADPSGKIEMNGSLYNYLFWESSYKMIAPKEKNTNGFCVAKADVLSFLEEKLTEVGFSSIEKADFITFWGPELIKSNYSVIRFMENEACDEFAELDISPKPNHVNRFYIVWSASNQLVQLKPQKLTPIIREGFSILEWGGQELPIYLF